MKLSDYHKHLLIWYSILGVFFIAVGLAIFHLPHPLGG